MPDVSKSDPSKRVLSTSGTFILATDRSQGWLDRRF
jgi:hypothetical protein